MDNSSAQTLPAIRRTVSLNAPIDKVWKAVATADGIAAWFMPNDFQPVLGHEFHLNSGPFGMSPCKVTELDPPNRLTFNWGKDWSLTFELVAEGDAATTFTLIHDGWDPNKVTEFGQTHAEVRERMAGGWAGIGTKLAEYVAES